jgi:hypothetical protein
VLAPWTSGSSLPQEIVPGAGGGLRGAPPVEGTPPVSASAGPGVTGIMPNGVSVPSDFPHINITTNNNPDSGYIFIDNRGGNGKPYNVIFDNSGSPIWYQRMPGERRDMKVQANGMLTMLTSNGFVGLNNHYEETTSYPPANGYTTNDHELQVMADGTYLLIGDHSETVDLSRYMVGGSTSAGVNGNCIQQFTPQGELIFQWRAWDHLDVAGQQFVVNTNDPGDFPHMNAVAVDSDGHFLLSSRNTSEITKINSDTGEIIWRLGGTHNQFTFLNDPLDGPRNQHAIRPLGNNRYTLFDNGDGHSPQVSRAVEYELNPSALTATIVWQYPAIPTTSLYSFYMGNAQRLPNGNTLICEGIKGNLFEVTTAGQTVWQYVCPVTTTILTQGESIPVDPARTDQFMNAVFRVTRYATNYAGLLGRDLTAQGTIELSVDQTLRVVSSQATAAGLQFSWSSLPSRNYAVLYKATLPAATWTGISTNRSIGTLTTFSNTNSARLSQPAGFYRVMLLP